MNNSLMIKEIDEKLMSNIGGVMGREISEVIGHIIDYVDDIKETAMGNRNSIKLINNAIKEINIDIKEVENTAGINSGAIKIISRKIDTLENDDSNKFNVYKTQAKSRVFQLVGDSSNCKHTLFYASFIQKLHSHVAKSLGVANTKKIYVEDFMKALELARTWYPDKKYIRDKVNEVLKFSTKKKLTDFQQRKSNALAELLNEVGGDIDAIEF